MCLWLSSSPPCCRSFLIGPFTLCPPSPVGGMYALCPAGSPSGSSGPPPRPEGAPGRVGRATAFPWREVIRPFYLARPHAPFHALPHRPQGSRNWIGLVLFPCPFGGEHENPNPVPSCDLWGEARAWARGATWRRSPIIIYTFIKSFLGILCRTCTGEPSQGDNLAAEGVIG